MFYVYALTNYKKDRLYIGMSSDPARRLSEHNNGLVFSTKAHRPYQLIHVEEFPNRQEARIREKQLKNGSDREFLKQFIPR